MTTRTLCLVSEQVLLLLLLVLSWNTQFSAMYVCNRIWWKFVYLKFVLWIRMIWKLWVLDHATPYNFYHICMAIAQYYPQWIDFVSYYYSLFGVKFNRYRATAENIKERCYLQSPLVLYFLYAVGHDLQWGLHLAYYDLMCNRTNVFNLKSLQYWKGHPSGHTVCNKYVPWLLWAPQKTLP